MAKLGDSTAIESAMLKKLLEHTPEPDIMFDEETELCIANLIDDLDAFIRIVLSRSVQVKRRKQGGTSNGKT